MLKIQTLYRVRLRLIAGPDGFMQDIVEFVVSVFHADGGDAVVMLLEEGGEGVFVGLGAADLESWVSEVHLRPASLAEQLPGHDISAHGVIFKLLQGRLIEVSMSVGVIAEIKTGPYPVFEDGRSCIPLVFDLKLALDDEADGGYVMFGERFEDTTIPSL